MSNWTPRIETTLSRRANARWFTVLFSFSLITGTTALAQNPLNTYTNFEGSQTTPLRISADGTRLYAVNTAAARLSVFDLTSPGGPTRMAEIPVGIEPVSVNPRTNDEVWVVNQESDSVSVVSVSKGIVTDTIRVSDEPADIVFAGSPTVAFVTNARAGTVSVINVSTHQLTKTISLTGGYPKALAVSPDGSKVYAVFAVSGNQTTLVPPNLVPPQPNPTNPALPPPPQVSKIVSITNSTYSFFLRFNMPDNDVAIIDANRQRVSGYYSGVGTLNFGITVRPGVGDLWVTNTDSLNLTDFEPTLKGHFVNNRVTRIQVGSSRIQAFDLNPNLDYNTLPNPQALAKALAQPTAAVFDPSGTFFWVAAFGTDRIAKVDTNGNVLSFVELGASGASADLRNKRGPRGLAVNGPANRLYVQNRIANTISVIDTSRGSLIAELPVGSFDPTPAEIRSGRGFLYDAKLSGNGTNSCASCHFDADMDHLAWNLGDPGGNMATVVSNGQTFQEHPMKGPMTTQTLKGLAGLAPYHWRGDRASFADFNGAFQSLMGGTQLATSDMSAYTAFINTIAFMPNPFQNLDRTLPTSLNGGNAVNGLNVFNTVFDGNTDSPTCQSCHTANPGPGSNNVVMLIKNAPQPLKVPELRNIYQKLLFNNNPRTDSVDGFGLNHDGNTPDMQTFLKEAFPLIARNATNAADLSAYSLCFDTGMAPSVGYARTVTATNVTTLPVIQDLVLLSNQAKAGNIDLIAKGTIQGKVHGLLYDPVSNTFMADQSGLGPFNQSQLGTFVRSGDTLTFMGVPPGSGRWMGIDFNLDGVLDGNQ